MKNQPVKVVQPLVDPVPVEVIATSIVAISDAMQKLAKGPLNPRAIELLVHASCDGVNITDVRKVIRALQSLKETYLVKPTKP